VKLIIWTVLVFLSPTLVAETPQVFYELPKVTAVQNRPYYLNHDVSVQAGFLPSDAFNKGYSFGGSYTYFFSEYLGWEVVNANYNVNAETSLKKDLVDNFGVQVQNQGFGGVLDYITYYATTNLVYTPLYTKGLLFNRSVIHGETSFVAGAGGANFKTNGIRPLISIGAYFRFFSKPDTSLKIDIRNNVYFESSLGAVNALSIMFAYSMQLGHPKYQSPTLESEE